MIYVALLRGINVGGHSIVSMAQLKTCFEQLGFTDVKTYINSGNVIFRTDEGNEQTLTKHIETAIERAFGSPIKVLLKTHQQLKDLAAKIPAKWANDAATRCDVLFLWPAVDKPEVISQLPINLDLEIARYEPGAVVWYLDRANVTKSRMSRIIGTPLYAQMTFRNVNTVRKLLTLTDSLR